MSEGTQFDAVVDENLQPIFNGTTKETITWIKTQRSAGKTLNNCDVAPGDIMGFVSIDKYLERYDRYLATPGKYGVPPVN